MLDDRELRVLAGIERNLSHTSPRLDRLLVEGRRSRLPQVMLGIGLIGFFVVPFLVSATPTVRVVLALGSAALIAYGLFRIPVHPDLPTSPAAAEDADRDD